MQYSVTNRQKRHYYKYDLRNRISAPLLKRCNRKVFRKRNRTAAQLHLSITISGCRWPLKKRRESGVRSSWPLGCSGSSRCKRQGGLPHNPTKTAVKQHKTTALLKGLEKIGMWNTGKWRMWKLHDKWRRRQRKSRIFGQKRILTLLSSERAAQKEHKR